VAVTRAVVLARDAVVDDHDVAELDAGAHRTAVWAAAEDQPTAEAGADREHGEVARAPSRPDPPLRDRRGVRVVVDPAGDLPALGHAVAEREVGERDVGRPDGAPRALIDRRRDAEPDRADAVVHQPLDRLVEPREPRLR